MKNVVSMMDKERKEMIGDAHLLTSTEVPMLPNAFDKPDQEKIKNIEGYFSKIMTELGLDLSDDSLSGTPYRVAKMYVKEMFYGLNPKNKPRVSIFENTYGYGKMIVEQNIIIDSACEHHFLPITGVAHVAYIPGDKLIGLSKINRLVDYFARRPQGQERLTLQILRDLQETLNTKDVIVMINAKHLCVSSRGIKDKSSFTTTIEYGGRFEEQACRDEFLRTIGSSELA